MDIQNDRVKFARAYAMTAHKSAETWGDGSDYYKTHLDEVYEIVMRYELGEIYQIGAYLHDILEDTYIRFDDINNDFGWEVTLMVFCVTDERGSYRTERKNKTYPKILSNQYAPILKLCDRIANVGNAKRNNKHEILNMYRRENEDFLTGIGAGGTRYGLIGDMVVELDSLLND